MDRSQYGKWSVRVIPVSASPKAVTGTDEGLCFTNSGASGSITFNLPQAKAGRGPFYFRVASAFSLIVAPAATDNIFPTGAGVSISYNVVGGLLVLQCFVDGTWDVLTNNGPFA